MKKLTFIENSNFFARIEDRSGKLWMVWGNPNQNTFSEARVSGPKAIILRDFMAEVLSATMQSPKEDCYQYEEEDSLKVLH